MARYPFLIIFPKKILRHLNCRVSTLALLLFIQSIPSFAQTFIKAGYTRSNVSFSENYAVTYSPVNGWLMGIGRNWKIHDSGFSIVGEMTFITKGAHEYYDTHGSAREVIITSTRLHYLEFPLLLRYETGTKSFKFYFNAGLSVAIGVGGNFKSERRYQEQYPTGPWTYAKQTGKVKFGTNDESSAQINIPTAHDPGFQAGAGIILANYVILDIRYGHGLSNLYSYEGKNRVIALSLGVQLPPVNKEQK
jgi:hypothetical protein